MPSTTNSKRGPGRPKGGRAGQAERRLKRELADKEGLIELLRATRDVIVELQHTATASPVLGIIGGITTLSIAHRFRLITTLDYTIGLAAVGLLEVGSVADKLGEGLAGVIASIGSLIPSVNKDIKVGSYDNLIAPSNNYTDARGQQDTAKKSVGVSDVFNVKPSQ